MLKKGVTIRIPSVPNFVLAEQPEVKFPITAFTDSELREIGKEWTRELIRRAAKQRQFHDTLQGPSEGDN